MSQIQVTKLTQHVALGPPAGHIAIPKLVMHVIMVPGEDSGVAEPRQAHVYAQKITR
jgi:hypothetical protein